MGNASCCRCGIVEKAETMECPEKKGTIYIQAGIPVNGMRRGAWGT